ncbi:4Fe-4S binding protein [Bacteroidota bacterium]
MSEEIHNLSIAQPDAGGNLLQKLGIALGAVGLLVLVIALSKLGLSGSVWLGVSLLCLLAAPIVFAMGNYRGKTAGIKNDGVWTSSLTAKGAIGWLVGIFLTGFYIVLYWFPAVLGAAPEDGSNSGLIGFFDPLSLALNGRVASEWFVYGTLYTVAILGLGIKFIIKYRHNRYQLVRTISVMVSQLFLAYLIPEILTAMNQDLPYFAKDVKNVWPLNYYFFDAWHLDAMRSSSLGMFYLVLGLLMFLIVTPVLTYYVGKRWYCSWVCGCGGLAETAGDPFRHLSSKKLSAWKVERWMIHAVMVFIFIMTTATLYGYFTGATSIFGLDIYSTFRKPYGFLIGAAFSGVVGVGFYPILGSRVWCRFGCPMAGYMGIIQRFKSRFRITTNGGQCISCGNCSTYCEQGIDVRWYAQRGQDVVRASCVGCGICSAVCPRGVLNLENGDTSKDRYDASPITFGNQGVGLTEDLTD